MKNSGLKNRFSEQTRNEWHYWYSCLVCYKNQQDALHHIVSPSSRLYIAGDHNNSVLNSAPIHNQVCHVGNEAFLYKDETIKLLLERTIWALSELGYEVNKKDHDFYTVYSGLYSENIVQYRQAIGL